MSQCVRSECRGPRLLAQERKRLVPYSFNFSTDCVFERLDESAHMKKTDPTKSNQRLRKTNSRVSRPYVAPECLT